MDTESKINTFISLLVIAALLLSYSMDNVSASNSTFYNSSQQTLLCKNAQVISSANNHFSGVAQKDKDSAPSQGTTTVSPSCSISLQVIPVKKQNMIPPRKTSFAFPPFTPAISSQAFVFQEPDPPQTI